MKMITAGLIVALTLVTSTCFAFTATELLTLRAAVQAEPSVWTAAQLGDDQTVADWLNAASGSNGWKTNFTVDSLLDVLNFTTFIGRSVAERDALRLMFAGSGNVNCGRTNVQQAFNDIFSGTGAAAVAQRAAITSACQRSISRAEKLLSAGLSGAAYVLTREGEISVNDASIIGRGN